MPVALTVDGHPFKAIAAIGAHALEDRISTEMLANYETGPRLGCFFGTFSPSCHQIRCTRFGFTNQPSVRNNALTLRYS